MIFGWKKPVAHSRPKGDWAELFRKLRFFTQDDPHSGLINFQDVSLSPTIHHLNLQIDPGTWVLLYGDDDFAKALFCDLCFSYIQPESGTVHPALKASDVSFIGRSNTTYGTTFVDHLICGVKDTAKDLLEFVASNVLSERFRRHLANDSFLFFAGGKKSQEMELDERDFMEIAEANLMLQKRKAAVIDTTTDFYQIALEQGFKHSDVFLQSGKTLIWIIDDKNTITKNYEKSPWKDPQFSGVDSKQKMLSLYFPSGSHADYIN